jgi:predicted Zn-dependent peptidase
MLDYKLTFFDNGLKLITAPLTKTRAVTLLFLVGVGSRYEEKNLNGISHFLEHMVFKGTKKRPTNLDIAKALDAVGASYNAFTAEDYTGFFVRAESTHFDLALDILFDLLYHSKFEEAEIEKEKGVIIEEINLYHDTPQSFIADVAKKLFYDDQPLGLPVTGSKETVKTFTHDDFIAYRDQFYTPDNMIVAVAGGKNKTDWLQKIQEVFAKVNLKKQGSAKAIQESQTKPQVLLWPKKTDQAHLVLAFRSIPRTDKRRPILRVLNNLLGENMSSRLFTEVREKRGLAYYISSEMAEFQDCGVFGVSAGVDLARSEEAVKVILEEFSKLKTTLVEEEELSRAKENLKGKLYLSLEESFAVADFLAEQALFWEEIDDPDTLVKKYQAVTAQEIQKIAQEFFVSKNLNLAMITPEKNDNKFRKILERFS